jgi:hypothetical protein
MVKDGAGGTAEAALAVTVWPAVNRPPVAEDAAAATDEDAPVAVTLQAGDPDGDALTYEIVAPPAHGVLGGVAPNLTYEPEPDFNGADAFRFKVNDGREDSAEATVSITVRPVNDPPAVSAGGTPAIGSAPLRVAFDAEGFDVDGDALSYAWVFGDGDTATGPTPAHVYAAAGAYEAVVTVSDGAASATATVTVVVRHPGDLNGDLIVNVDDLIVVTSHYGRDRDDPNWDPCADANGDGVVNVEDITAVTSCFGRRYP